MPNNSDRIDPRLRVAVDASLGWYDALCAVHGVRCGIEDGTWVAYDPPPPLHSVAKTVEPGTGPERALEALAARGGGAIADSFGELDLQDAGLDLLFDARWIHRDAPAPATALPAGWSVVTTPDGLAAWNAQHDTEAVLLPGLLSRSTFRVLVQHVDGVASAGAVAHVGTGAVEVSNAWTAPDVELDWAQLCTAVATVYPGRALVGWAHGAELAQARHAGFAEVGYQRVWLQPG